MGRHLGGVPTHQTHGAVVSAWVFQVFIFRDGQFLGTEMVTGDVFDVGREPGVAVLIQDEAASRRHCRIGGQADGQVVLQDLGSANGTFVNNQRVQGTCFLTPRDDVRIGRHTFKLKIISQGAAAAPVAPGGFAEPVQTALMGKSGGAAAGRALPGDDATELEIPLPNYKAPVAAAAAPPAPAPAPFAPAPAPFPQAPAPAQARAPAPAAVSPPVVPPAPAALRGAPPPMPPMSDPTAEAPIPPDLLRQAAARGPVPPSPVAPPPAPPAAFAPPAPAPQAAPPHAAPAPHAAAHAADAHAAGPSLGHGDHGDHGHDEDEDDDHDDEPHVPYSLVRHLSDEKRLSGARVVAEVMEVDGDSLGGYAVVPVGARHRIQVPGPQGSKKALTHPLVNHQKAGVEISLGAGMTGRLLRNGAAQELPATATLAAGDVALVNWNNHGFMVRVAPAPAQLAEVAKGPLEDLAQRRQNFRVLGISGGGSVLAHFGLFMLFFVASLLSPNARITQLEDEFAEVKTQEVQLEEPPEPEKPPEPEPAPPPPEVKPQPQPKMAKTRPTGKQQPTPAPEAPAPKPGILAALTKLPQGKTGGNQTLLAAVSNINAVKVPGGQAGFKVSSLIGKGPANSVQVGGAGGGVSTKSLNSILREGGAGVLGGKGKGVVRAAPTMALHRQAQLQGELSREEIAKVINQHMGEIQFCYERELLKSPALQGKIVFEWTIKPDGHVLQVRTKAGDLSSPAAANCMIDKIKGWLFPKPRGNGVVVVTYPFVFKQSGF